MKRFGFSILGSALLAAALAGNVRADVKLPGILTENMVVQQKTPAHFWGWADDGEAVTVTFAGKKASTVARDGKWSVYVAPPAAGGPYAVTIQGKNQIAFQNVLVGEVWLCGGQSNMEFALKRAFEGEKHIAAAANPRIRLIKVAKVRSDTPKDDIKGVAGWQECSPQSVADFSAVGYFFGRDLEKAKNVPIGLIDSNWGGTPAESWTRESVLTDDPKLKEIVDAYPAARARLEKQLADYPAAVEKAKAENKRPPNRPNLWRYAELYNAMIAPLTPFPIQGAIWYQGESNAGKAEQYATLLPAMINNWRTDWHNPTMSFLIVQLAPYMAINPEPEDTGWAHLREAQRMTAKRLPHVGMAVITDVGEEKDIHPTKKEPVGVRLALLARKITYGENLVAEGPTIRSMRVEGDKAILRFDSVGDGLEARGGEKLTGFAIAGADGKYVWADATIQSKDTIVVRAPSSVPHPVNVRYGWANYPVVNLWNKSGLPASPFEIHP